MRADGLPVRLEQPLDRFLSIERLCQEAPVRDLPDVAGVQMDRNGEAVLQLVELRRVVSRLFDDLRQRLLTRRRDPHLALAQFLEIPRQSVHVQDQFPTRGDVLAGLVD